jgi:hypothetical protein
MKSLSFEQRCDIAYQISCDVPVKKVCSQYSKYDLNAEEADKIANQYWFRWHKLLDIKAAGGFTEEERREYASMETIVKKIDEREAKRCEPALKRLTDEHKKLFEGIEKFIENSAS